LELDYDVNCCFSVVPGKLMFYSILHLAIIFILNAIVTGPGRKFLKEVLLNCIEVKCFVENVTENCLWWDV
jgi:hypothetical protein